MEKSTIPPLVTAVYVAMFMYALVLAPNYKMLSSFPPTYIIVPLLCGITVMAWFFRRQSIPEGAVIVNITLLFLTLFSTTLTFAVRSDSMWLFYRGFPTTWLIAEAFSFFVPIIGIYLFGVNKSVKALFQHQSPQETKVKS